MLGLITPVFTQFAAACQTKGIPFLPSWYKYLDSETVSGRCSVQFVFDASHIGRVLLAITELLLRVGAILAVVYVIYGGVQFVLSQGEPDKVKGARQTIQNALIGLAIALSATAIVNLIGSRFN